MELKLQSDEIDQLMIALMKAKQESGRFEADGKSKFKPYVTINEIRDKTEEAFENNNIIITQDGTIIDGKSVLVTLIYHTKSKQWKRSYVILDIEENPPNLQWAIGAAKSYARRYELYGLLGFLGEDNDPESASALENKQQDYNPKENNSNVISDKQLALLKVKLKGNQERERKICEYYKIKELRDLSWKFMKEVLTQLEKQG